MVLPVKAAHLQKRFDLQTAPNGKQMLWVSICKKRKENCMGLANTANQKRVIVLLQPETHTYAS